MAAFTDDMAVAQLRNIIGDAITDRRTTLNPVDVANFATIIDIANVGIAVKALEEATPPYKFTIQRNHGLNVDHVMALFLETSGKLKENLVIDFQASRFTELTTEIVFFAGHANLASDENFSKHEKLFLKCASFWLERCYNISVYQGFLKPSDDIFITGGALNRFYNRVVTAKSPWLGSVGDVDFWFMKEADTISFRERWGIGNCTEDENLLRSYDNHQGVYTTTQGMDPLFDMKFQFIHFSAYDPEQMNKVFDFQHCLPFWASDDKTLYVNPDHFRYIKAKLLVPCPKGAQIIIPRLRKYQEQGFEKIKFDIGETVGVDWYIDNVIAKAPLNSSTSNNDL